MADEGFKRKLTAILSADVEGYSRLMGEDEEATVRTLTAYREVLFTLIQQHNGTVLDSPGDNLLAEFVSVVDAVQCAVAVQKEIKARNDELPENRKMQFRIGINLGDVIQEKDRIYGDGVNIAARLEGLAEPGGICISKTAFDHIESKLPYGYEFLGDQTVKNIVKPVGVYRVLMEPRVTVVEEMKAVVVIPFWRRKASVAGVIAAVTAIMGVAVWNFYFRPPPIEPASVERMAFELPDKPSIAVLPFENLSGDPQQEYVSDGISEAIINALSKVPRMFVIARNSSFTYKGKPVKVQQVAEELGVQYVLEGSVQRSGEKLRVTTQLIDALKGHHLWSEQYDIKMDDLLAVQDKIAMNILVETQVKLTDGEQVHLLKRETNSLKAYEKYLEASKYYNRTNREDMYKARQLYEEAIRLDPDFSGAYRGIAATHFWDAARRWSQDPGKSWQLATEYARKALDLDENNSFNLLFWSRIVQGNGDHEQAIEICRRALKMNPNHAAAYEALAGTLFNAGRYEEAIPLQEKAGRLNPFPPASYYRNSGLYYWFAGRHEHAIAASKKALHLNPDDITTFRNLVAIYTTIGQEEKARVAAAEVLRLDPSFTIEREFKTMGWKDREGMERYMDSLRKAGLPEKPTRTLPEKPSIAVLPFVNMSDDPKQAYFCDGIADQIITSISKIPYILVIARNSSFAYKGKSVNVQQIAGDLGVRYILEGSLQRDNENVRINIQLVDAKTGGHLWAEYFDRKLDDIFSLQDEVCKNIMVALQVKLTAGEMARMSADTVSIKAYEKYLKAREHYLRRNREESLVARQLFQEAIALDPEYASTYVEIGWTYLDDIWLGMTKTPAESIAKAEEMVQKAISIRGLTAGENALLSSIHLLKKDWDKAIAYAEKAVEQRPNYAGPNNILGYALRSNGQYEEAISRFKKAIQLNPIKKIAYLNGLALTYLFSKQYEEAISIWNQTLENNPNYLYAYMGLTMAYWFTGSEDQARQAARQVLRVNPKFSVDYMEKRSTVRDKELKEKLFDALRKAGLK
jgi:adenylate cyclase